MVKSFQGVREVEPRHQKNQAILVKEHMTTNLITFRPKDSLGKVLDTLARKRISGAPVLDDNGKLVGIISEVDCLAEVIKGQYTNTPRVSALVEDRMTKDVMTLSPDLTIFDAAEQFLKHKIRRFPVVKNGELLGQISLSDIIRIFNSIKSTTW